MDPIGALEDQYISLRENLDAFKDAGATPDQIKVLQDLTARSRGNFLKAVKNALTQHNAEVDALTAQVQGEQQILQTAVDHIENVAKVIDLITQAVQTGTALVTKILSL